MQLRYVGPARESYTLSLPVPFVSLSEKIGDVHFQAPTFVNEVPDEYVEYLLDDCCGGIFEPVAEAAGETIAPKADRMEEKLEKACTKRFTGKTGKWEAKAYIKRHKLEGLVELVRNQYGQWTFARPGEPEAHNAPISSEGEGQEVASGSEVISVG